MNLKVNNKNIPRHSKGEIKLPENKGDAGYDLISSSAPKVVGEIYQGYLFKNISYIEYETNISIEPNSDEFEDYDFFSYLFPRSSISKYNLSLCNSVGVIDSGYRGTIKVRFNYLIQPENISIVDGKHLLTSIDKSKIYQKGDKICQLIFSRHIHPKIFMTKKTNQTKRNKGGFGSTGK